MTVRVVIADAVVHVRSALRLLLEQDPAGCYVSELTTGDQLLLELERADADLLLVDAQIPGLHLMRVLPTIRRTRPALRVIVLSSRPEDRVPALAAGADAFVSKGDAPRGLRTILQHSCADLASCS